MKETNNRAYISGVIAEKFCYNHDVYGEKFYTSVVDVKRTSGAIDKVPIMVSDRLADIGSVLIGDGKITDKWVGKKVCISGQFRSFNKHDDGHSHLILYLFAQEFLVIDDTEYDNNEIKLDGYICKSPVYRQTPSGREICDVLIAVNRAYKRSDYIPCICWGRNARFVNTLEIGTRVKIKGRIQSREYTKNLSDTESETRTAYEISASRLEVINSGEEN